MINLNIIKKIKITPKAVILSATAVGVLTVSALSANLNKTALSRSKTSTRPEGMENDPKESEQYYAKFRKWLSSVNNEKLEINSFDNLKLHALTLYPKNPDGKWVIIVHGYTSWNEEMYESAYYFFKLGYNVLLPDCRGHGKSEGNYIGMGWYDRLDIMRWIKKITDTDENSKIVLYGLSMGGATVMMASGENLPVNVKCIINDCGYTSVSDEFSYQIKRRYKLPKYPFIPIASTFNKIKRGFSFYEASALKQVSKSKTPILFIHGEKDDFVPTEMVNRLYNATKCRKDLLIIPEASHANACVVNPQMYWGKVNEFLDKYISDKSDNG